MVRFGPPDNRWDIGGNQMLRRRIVLLVCSALVCATGWTLATEPATAQRTPSVTLTVLTPKIDVGVQPKFQYSTSSVPAGSVVVLQLRLPNGTWSDVATRLPGTKTVLAPVVSLLGKYTYRMQVRHDAVVVTQTALNQVVYAYSAVSMQSVCPVLAGTRVCAKNTTNVGGTSLVTWMAVGAAVY